MFRKLSVEDNLMAILQTLPISGQERRDRMKNLISDLGLETVRHSKGYMLSGGERRRLRDRQIPRAAARFYFAG